MNDKLAFWIFGILQSLVLGLIIFFIFKGLDVIGTDTQIWLSISFPSFLLVMEYIIYSKKSV